MLQVQGLSLGGTLSAVAMDRPVRDRLGAFSPRPFEPPQQIVVSVHPIETGPQADPSAVASRLYLSNGLLGPEGVLRPKGWLIDVAA